MARDTRIPRPRSISWGTAVAVAAALLFPATARARGRLPDHAGGEVIVRFRDGADPDAAARALGAAPRSIRRVVPERLAVEERLRTSPFPRDASGRVVVRGRAYPSLAAVPANELFAASYADMPPVAKALYRSYLVSLPASVDVETAVRRLAADSDVEYAEPNYVSQTTLVPSDPLYPQQWSHQMTHAEEGWDVERGDAAVVIAIIDTGVGYSHPDLAPNVWTDGAGHPGHDEVDVDTSQYRNAGFQLVSGEDYADPDDDPRDMHGHGTHVAGIAAARGDDGIGVAGVCHFCRIMPVRAGFALAADGAVYGVLENDDIGRAITWAADHGARILNMSFGGYQRSQLVEDAIAYAHDVKGVIPVAAAGNSGSEYPQYPASYDHVISVASIGVDGDRSWFSNFGFWVDVAAPGGGGAYVLSTVPPAAADGDPSGYRGFQGTSMASPYVAGVAGLLLSKLPGLDADQTVRILASTADPPLSDEYVGGGLVNVARALGVPGPSLAEATITFPEPRDAVIEGPVAVVGTASGSSYRLEVGEHVYAGPWTLVATGSAVTNGVLGVIDPATLLPGRAYYLRLTVTDAFDVVSVVPIYAGWRQAVEARLSPATAVDLDGDGTQEIVVASHYAAGAISPTRLYVWRRDGQSAPGFPIDVDGAFDPFIPAPAVGDLDGDGNLEIVHVGRGGISIFNHDGTPHLPWPAPIFTNQAATLVDLDGDGTLEIVAPAGWDGEIYSTSGMWAWHHDGSVVAGFPLPIARATSVAAGDLDGDGRPELAFVENRYAFQPARVHVVHADGSPMPGWPREVSDLGKWNLYGNPPPMLADVDGDGDVEIVTTPNMGRVLVWNHDGTLLEPPLPADIFTPPALVDLDHDGDLEIVYAEAVNRLDNRILALHHDGTPVAGWPAIYPPSNGRSYVGAMIVNGDVDGDGVDEVVATVWDRVFAWHGDGTLVDGFPLAAPCDPDRDVNFRYAYPALTDLDGDARVDLVVPVNFSDVYLFELPAGGTPSFGWPMYQHDPAHTGFLPPHCGNGRLDAGEQCDDGGDSPLCNRNCRFAACGDGVRNPAAGEDCDGVDGADAGCCTAACLFEPAATPCDDDNLCTQADACAAGVCAGTTEPAALCRRPLRTGASSLKIVDRPNDASDGARWKTRVSSASVADLGDPVASTSYQLCMYDHGGVPARTTMQRTISAGGSCKRGPCWKALGSRGFRYNGDVETLNLKVSSNGQATIVFKGRGTGLGPPPLPAVPDVVVQLHNVDSHACWGATFEQGIRQNDGILFQARSD